MELIVRDRKDRQLATLSLPSGATVDDLKTAFHKQSKKHYPARQYFTIGTDKTRVTLQAGKSLSEYGLKSGDVVVFKDLGPQIGWSTVFYIEYFGPILIHALFFFFPSVFYPSFTVKPYSYAQTVAFWSVVFHFAKREFETAFIHRFSLETMPIFNIFKNCAHYWLTSGLLIAYFLYHPLYTPTLPDWSVNMCVVFFIICQIGNFFSHITLRDLRPAGTRQRGIPRGGMFEYATCANYTYELGAWFFFSILSQTLASWIFLATSFFQITQWALKKHRQLKKEFGDKVPRRKALIPFVL